MNLLTGMSCISFKTTGKHGVSKWFQSIKSFSVLDEIERNLITSSLDMKD